MRRKGLLTIVSLLVLLNLFVWVLVYAPLAAEKPKPVPGVQPKVIKWRAQNYSTGTTWGQSAYMTVYWADWIKRVTNGRLEVEVFAPDSIVPTANIMSAVSKGTLDVGYAYGGLHTGILPEATIEIGLPYAWENESEALDAFIKYGLLERFRKIYGEQKIFFTPVPLSSNYPIQMTSPISSLKDLKGKKIRALGMYADWVRTFGGAPTTVSASELYMALKLGTVDGIIYSSSGLQDYKLEEVIKYIVIRPNPNNITLGFLINMGSLNALPEDIRTLVVESVMPVGSLAIKGYNIATETSLRRSAEKYGIKIVEFTGEDRKEAIAVGISLWDSVAAKSPRCAELVNILKQQMRDYGRLK